MANYCTYSDVSALYGTTYTASTTPTSTQVTAWITLITSEIDTVLYKIGITSQPTDTDALNVLKIYCSFGTACLVGMVHYHNSVKINDTKPVNFCQKYKEFIEDPSILLNILGPSSDGVSNIVLDGTKTEDEIEKTFLDNDYEY